jgi:phytoene synthase
MTPTLEQSYAECRRLHRRYGTTYYWATMLLPSVKRHHVHALYAFCRYADELVDELASSTAAERAAALDALGERFFADLERGRSEHLVLKAVVHTVRAFDIDSGAFARFLRSMAMDLTVNRYETWDDLCRYTDGSAAVIGEMMLPILEPPDLAAATPPARALGEAFQLTNFLRDIDEDLGRGRQYVPQEDLRAFGVDLADRKCTPQFIELMRFEIDRCRRLYVAAEPGIAMLPGRSARCVSAAHDLYGRILNRIEAQDYDVFARRARVPTPVKLAVVARHLASTSVCVTGSDVGSRMW